MTGTRLRSSLSETFEVQCKQWVMEEGVKNDCPVFETTKRC